MTSDFDAACERVREIFTSDEYAGVPMFDGYAVLRGIFDIAPITAEALAAMGLPRSAKMDGWHLGGDLHLCDSGGGDWIVWALDDDNDVEAATPTTLGHVRCLMLGVRP